MKLFFIRHGQTDWNLQKKIQGSCDIGLNETGIRQAKELAEKIIKGDYRFSKIYSSSQKRAVMTAEILSQATNVDYSLIDGLKEINLGEWEGLSWDGVKKKYTAEFDEWFENRRYSKPPKGESYEDMLKRVLEALHMITEECGENALIVTHSAVIMCLQCFITDTPFDKMKKFNVENTEIIEIESSLLMAKHY